VRDFLDEHRPPDVKLVVVGPTYLSVRPQIDATVTDFDLAGQVELALSRDLKQFLHPVTGGREGTGWAFGQIPEKSHLYRWIESVPGISHVRQVKLDYSAADTGKYRHFLISPEEPRVKLNLED
jgi:hypothetical protein